MTPSEQPRIADREREREARDHLLGLIGTELGPRPWQPAPLQPSAVDLGHLFLWWCDRPKTVPGPPPTHGTDGTDAVADSPEDVGAMESDERHDDGGYDDDGYEQDGYDGWWLRDEAEGYEDPRPRNLDPTSAEARVAARAALRLLPAAREELDQLETGLLLAARATGMTWTEMADALGLGSAQACQQRAGRLAARTDRAVAARFGS